MLYRCEVSALKAEAPAPFMVRLTCHWFEVVDSPALAEVTCLPCTLALSRTYLPQTPPLLPQATTCRSGLS